MSKNLTHLSKCAALGLVCIAATACSQIPAEAYYERGSPESLLDVSSEVVNLSTEGEVALAELTQWIEQDQPTRAELYCAQDSADCAQAQEIMALYGIPNVYVPAEDNTVSLVYERVLARDCENRYIDQPINPYHLNYSTFGCSTAANMVQMVADKQQFVSPNLMDYPDARKPVQAYQLYLAPPQPPQRTGINESAVEASSSE